MPEMVEWLATSFEYVHKQKKSMYQELFKTAQLDTIKEKKYRMKIWIVIEYFRINNPLQPMVFYYLTISGRLMAFCVFNKNYKVTIYDEEYMILTAMQQNPLLMFYDEASDSFNEITAQPDQPQPVEDLPGAQEVTPPQAQPEVPHGFISIGKPSMLLFAFLVIAVVYSWLSSN